MGGALQLVLEAAARLEGDLLLVGGIADALDLAAEGEILVHGGVERERDTVKTWAASVSTGGQVLIKQGDPTAINGTPGCRAEIHALVELCFHKCQSKSTCRRQ